MTIEEFASKTLADYVALLRRERGLPVTPPSVGQTRHTAPPAGEVVYKSAKPIAVRSGPMTPAEICEAIANRHRLTLQAQAYVAAQIVKTCLDPPTKVIARQVTSKVAAQLPARVALSSALAAAVAKATRPRLVQPVDYRALLAARAKRCPTACEPSR
jgi:hypothetical protein